MRRSNKWIEDLAKLPSKLYREALLCKEIQSDKVTGLMCITRRVVASRQEYEKVNSLSFLLIYPTLNYQLHGTLVSDEFQVQPPPLSLSFSSIFWILEETFRKLSTKKTFICTGETNKNAKVRNARLDNCIRDEKFNYLKERTVYMVFLQEIKGITGR